MKTSTHYLTLIRRWSLQQKQIGLASALDQAIGHQGRETSAGSEISSEIIAAGASTAEQILVILASEPRLSARLLAQRLELSSRAIEKHLANLQAAGRLRRVGSARAGQWQVL